MTEDELKKLALDIVNECRKGDKAEMIAEKKVIPMLKIFEANLTKKAASTKASKTS